MTQATHSAPVLRKEAVTVESLGGDVILRAMLGSERLSLGNLARLRGDPAGAQELGDDFKLIPRLLAKVVLNDKGEPFMTAEEWDIHGGEHPEDLLRLFDRCQELSGRTPGEARKNS